MPAKNEQKIPYKIYLTEEEMPKAWYNMRSDMKVKPAPLLNPGTGAPMTAEELSGVFCEELVQQELDEDTAYIEIPQEIQDFYKMYRPAPLVRAYCLEEKLGTPAKICNAFHSLVTLHDSGKIAYKRQSAIDMQAALPLSYERFKICFTAFFPSRYKASSSSLSESIGSSSSPSLQKYI